MNSFRNVQHALEYEIKRQGRALDAGERIVQETRLWDPEKEQTISMRSKEFAHDYRYFPEPDLPPLKIEPALIERLRESLPVLPAARRRRFREVYLLNAHDAEVATQSRGLADYVDEAAKGSRNPKAIVNWVLNEVLRVVPGDDEKAITLFPIKPANLRGLVTLIEDATISGKIAKDVFEKMYRSGEDARTIVIREGLTQVADAGALGVVVDTVLAEHAKVVADYKAGKKAALGFLVGQVMKLTAGKASPAVVNSLLAEKLSKL
jgi:aspartyl-tRNA(Asn)/glutamyl-tRNA(Gln) amidotransferase subunit B